MLVAFSVAPSGVGTASAENADGSVHDAVAAAVSVVRASGLPHRTTSMFTEIEGEWDEDMEVVKRATLAVAEHGTRVSLVLKADYRPGHTGELEGKVKRLEAALAAVASEEPAAPGELIFARAPLNRHLVSRALCCC